MEKLALSLHDVVKTYHAVEAVRGINFDVASGEFFGFLGPNGAGKTTTIHMITGLATITRGSIAVFGKDVVRHYRETRSCIGLAAQEPAFDPFFPIHRVLEFQAGYFGFSWEDAKKRAAMLLQRFGLWEHREKTPRQISGGMKRRLLIAKALVHDPALLILDEPTAGVDVELRRDLWELLRELNHEGKTIMLTTHYIEEAEALCNRIGIIHHGAMKAIEEKNALMEKLSEKSIEFVVDVLPQEIIAKLARMMKIQITEAPGDTTRMIIRFPSDHVEQHLASITSLLQNHHIAIHDINVTAFDLEDIFLQLTEK